MQELIDEFMSLKRFAIVGASDNPEKYGYEIVCDLKNRGYEVYPVNPRIQEIEGIKCYPSLADLPVAPDVVDLVVPPRVTENVLEECKSLGFKRVWIQPGAESREALDYCNENGFQVVHDVCVMMSGPAQNKPVTE